MLDRLYKIVHWIGRAADGLRLDQSPEGGLLSDSVVTLSLREDEEKFKKMVMEGESPTALFSHNFLVNSLDGKTGEELSATDLLRVWALFTLYIRDIALVDVNEEDPFKKLIDVTVKLTSTLLRAMLEDALAKKFSEFLDQQFGCKTCDKKEECETERKKDGDDEKNDNESNLGMN